MQSNNKKILIVRNDKLGDFMLAWPAFATLKQNMPDCEIHVLVSHYTADMAKLCPNIDSVIIDPGKQASLSDKLSFTAALKKQHYDAVITLFSTTHIGWMVMCAGIPYRLAPATKFAQLFYNQRLKQRRSLSEQPEYAYNQALVMHYLSALGIQPATTPEPPFLEFDNAVLNALKNQFCHQHGIQTDHKLIFIHPGSGGSANNLSLEQYADIARSLRSRDGHAIVISAGPSEIDYAETLGKLLGDTPHTVYASTQGLEQFSQHIAIADLFISGSTGPLHIAGALNCNTAAFYPRRRSATALRWQTTNEAHKRLWFSPPEGAEQEAMSTIDTSDAAQQISEKFLLI